MKYLFTPNAVYPCALIIEKPEETRYASFSVVNLLTLVAVRVHILVSKLINAHFAYAQIKPKTLLP